VICCAAALEEDVVGEAASLDTVGEISGLDDGVNCAPTYEGDVEEQDDDDSNDDDDGGSNDGSCVQGNDDGQGKDDGCVQGLPLLATADEKGVLETVGLAAPEFVLTVSFK